MNIENRLAFSTLPCTDYNAKQLNEVCERYGFVGAEVRANGDNTFTHGDGLHITNIGSGVCIREFNQELLDGAIKLLESIEAEGIKAMRVFLGNFAQRFDAKLNPIDHDGIVKMLQALCDATSVEVWVETHNEYATGKVLSKLLADVDRPSLKIIWDVIHPIEDGEAPSETLSYLGKNIAHVHIKDGVKRADPIWHDYEYRTLGNGELPLGEIVGLLESAGYNGLYSIEWESLWRSELKELNWSVDEIMQSYIEFMKKI